MPLASGTNLGHYEIVSALGAGGMGEVYRARDSKLGRDVALKVLPKAFAREPERLGRFAREAQVLASLNHPHIAAIFGFEDSAGSHALVMESVEGPTLADLVASAPMPLTEVLPIAKQICEALELWKVKWGGSGLSRVPASIPLLYNFNYLRAFAANQFDISPDGRRVFQTQQVVQENIGIIDNLP
jgi:serine/threonine protein kinase